MSLNQTVNKHPDHIESGLESILGNREVEWMKDFMEHPQLFAVGSTDPRFMPQ